MKKRKWVLFGFLLLSLSFPRLLSAWAGDLDVSFDGDGKGLYDAHITAAAAFWDKAQAVAVQSDGSIFVAGLTGADGYTMALLKLTATGARDTTFDGDGIALIPPLNLQGWVSDIFLQIDGKILVAGTTDPWEGGDFLLAQFNSNGSPDASFGTGGYVTTDFGGGDWGKGMAVQLKHDGTIHKIVMVGNHDFEDFALARYEADGSLDLSFGTGGKVTTHFGNGGTADAVSILSHGKIVVGGYVLGGNDDDETYYNFAVAQYDFEGNLDTSFGSNGRTIVDIGGFSNKIDTVNGMAVLPGGTIVLAGYTTPPPPPSPLDPWDPPNERYYASLAKFTSDGILDSSFSDDGKLFGIFPEGDEKANAVTVQQDGKFLVAGNSNSDFFLARYHPNGSLDTSFGDCDGVVTTDFFADKALAMALGPDDTIVLAGDAQHPSLPGGADFAIARYFSEPPKPFWKCLSIFPVPPLIMAPLEWANLRVTKSAPGLVFLNRTFSYTIKITNNGPDSAANVVLSDTLPSGVTFVSSTPATPACTVVGGKVTCNLGTMASGTSKTVSIKARANKTGTRTNSVTVTSGTWDMTPANNTAVASTYVLWWPW